MGREIRYLNSVNEQVIWVINAATLSVLTAHRRPRVASVYCTHFFLCSNMYPRDMENCLKWGEILWMNVLDVTLGVVFWVAGDCTIRYWPHLRPRVPSRFVESATREAVKFHSQSKQNNKTHFFKDINDRCTRNVSINALFVWIFEGGL